MILLTATSRDWCIIETIWNYFCPQSRLFPSDWCHCRVDHVTILLPVWRFWPFGVSKTVENGGNGDVPGRGTCQKLKHWRGRLRYRDYSRNIAIPFVLKNYNGVATRWLKNWQDMCSGVHRIPACDKRTDRRTYGHTSCHGIVSAMHTRRARKK